MSKLVLLLLCFAVAIVGFNLLVGNQYKKFLKTAEKTEGQIVAKEERSSGQKNRRMENWLRYHYTVDGKEYTGEDRIEHKDVWMDWKEGDTIAVLYNRGNPKESYPEAMVNRRLGVVDAIVGKPAP